MASGAWRRWCAFNGSRSGALAHDRLGIVADALTGRTAPAGSATVSYGAGWYASSWDLQRGLDVLEGLPADARPDEALTAYFLAQGLGR